MMKVAAQHAIITKRHTQDIFHTGSNIGWSTIKIVLPSRSLSVMMGFCNILAYLSPVTLIVTKPESCIFWKKRGLIMVDVVNLHHTVTFLACNGVCKSLGSPNSGVVRGDRPP